LRGSARCGRHREAREKVGGCQGVVGEREIKMLRLLREKRGKGK
jgi:hypothetical protein